MKNDDKVTPNAHLIYLTKLTPSQLTEQLKNEILEEGTTESFTESLKNGFHFTGRVSESSFHLKTRDKHEYKLKGKFFEEADYTKVEVVFEYDNFISKKWRTLLLLVFGALFIGFGTFILLAKRDDLWVAFILLGMPLFVLLFPNHKEKYLISSYKNKLGKILGAYEFIEK